MQGRLHRNLGHSLAMRGETRLSTATVEASLYTGLLEPIELSLELVNLVVLFMLNYFQSVELTKNKSKEIPAFRTRYRGQYAN